MRIGVGVVGEVAPWLGVTWDWEAVSTNDSEGESAPGPPLTWMGLLRGEPLAKAAARDLVRSLLGGWGEGDLLTLWERVLGVAPDMIEIEKSCKKLLKTWVKDVDWRLVVVSEDRSVPKPPGETVEVCSPEELGDTEVVSRGTRLERRLRRVSSGLR